MSTFIFCGPIHYWQVPRQTPVASLRMPRQSVPKKMVCPKGGAGELAGVIGIKIE